MPSRMSRAIGSLVEGCLATRQAVQLRHDRFGSHIRSSSSSTSRPSACASPGLSPTGVLTGRYAMMVSYSQSRGRPPFRLTRSGSSSISSHSKLAAYVGPELRMIEDVIMREVGQKTLAGGRPALTGESSAGCVRKETGRPRYAVPQPAARGSFTVPRLSSARCFGRYARFALCSSPKPLSVLF